MEPVRTFITLSSINIDESSEIPAYRQIHEAIRMRILSGGLVAGSRIPSSRQLATALSISRNTVATAYDNLKQEGLLESHTGSGTFVHRSLPFDADSTGPARRRSAPNYPRNAKRLSVRGRKISGLRGTMGSNAYRSDAFRPRLPALDVFPSDVWNRLSSRRWRKVPSNIMTNGGPAGYYPLREIIALYLSDTRGVSCDPGQVVIVTGTPQAMALTSTVLLDPNDPVWIEDPGYPRVRATLLSANADLIPIPVDEQGLDIEAAISTGKNARMLYVTPAHQYPMGMSMSLSRRLQISQWATDNGSWIVEDDYGTEFRSGIPIAALQGFGSDGRVIYIGGFENVLFSSLRLSYIVVPDDLVDAFVSARLLIDRSPSLFNQMVLADFMAESHFDRHLKRLRTSHQERQQVLIESLHRSLGDLDLTATDEPGMQLVIPLPDDVNDEEVSARIMEQDIEAPPLSFYSIEEQRRGLVLGYAAPDKTLIQIGVNRMAPILARCLSKTSSQKERGPA